MAKKIRQELLLTKKTELLPREIAMAFVLNRYEGLSQNQIASAFGISNVGRINEAIITVEYLTNNLHDLYALARGKMKLVERRNRR